ncbi:CotH kinase family protein, partial [Flavobacteriales bacterium]|nr:CotH kinase family protein [Flavobacteriales bacterium]
AVNNEFLNKHFTSSSNVLVKGNPEEVDLYGENSNLSNTPGIDSSSYFSLYTMESVYGWGDFYGMIDTLNNFKHAISDVLNVDRVLWMHALNYTFVNFDSYIGYAQNYYMYQDDHGRFNPILWDLNMSFGSFRLADASFYYDDFTISQAKTIDPLSHYYDYSVYPRPLLRNLFESSRYRKMYLAHIRTIIEENFLDADFVTRGEALSEFIENSVLADTNKFYSNADFQNNLYTTVTDLVEYPGLVDLMEGRTAYLSSYYGYQGAPSIDSISYNPQVPATGDTLTITSKINNATEVLLSFRYGDKSLFETVSMNDSGLNGDEFPLDGMYTAQVVYHGADLAYYIFAENDSSGVFSPQRAAYEFYTIAGTFSEGDLVINELMASNKTSQSDDENEFDDWLELYNTSESPIALLGLFLSDDLSDLNKWALPDMFIQPDDYLIVWADSETSQSGVHSNFKLNATGEQLFLSDAGSTILDSLTFPQQLDDVSYARQPNGTGSFTFSSATFNTSNDSATIIPKTSNLVLDVHPNPVNETLFITIESQAKSMLSFYDALGRLLYSELFTAGIIQTTISTKGLKPGVYFSVLRSNDSLSTKKVIKF